MKGFKAFIEASRWKQSSWAPQKDSLQILKQYNQPNYFASFTYMGDKLGINPKPKDAMNTPYGIFAYPVKYVLTKGITNLPYAAEAPYIWVFTPKRPNRIGKIRQIGDKAWKSYQGCIGKYSLGDVAVCFLDKGVDGYVDYGTGTIHPNEPVQAVFFGSQTVIPVKVMDNSLADFDLKNFDLDTFDLKKAVV